MIGTNFSWAHLSDINLSYSNCNYLNFNYTTFHNIDLFNTIFNNVNLSSTKGLISPIDYLNNNFEKTSEGYIVYKSFGNFYNIPYNWQIKPNSIIEEEVNYNRCDDCGVWD